jgi:hypothetical protein
MPKFRTFFVKWTSNVVLTKQMMSEIHNWLLQNKEWFKVEGLQKQL